MAVQQFDGFFENLPGDGLVVGVGEGEMGAGDKTSAKGEKKKKARQEQRLERRTPGNGRVVEIAWRNGTPVDVRGNGWRRILLDRAAHKYFSKLNKMNTLQYSIGAWVCASAVGTKEAPAFTKQMLDAEGL